MELSTPEKIKIILMRRNMTLADLAEKTGQSRQNLSQKLKRNNLGEEELKALAAAMGCEYESYFKVDGEQV